MSDWHFIHCRECDALFRPSPHDRTPEFRMTLDGYTEIIRDECMDFLVRHARHSLQTLRPAGGVTLHTGAPSDPLAVTYWQVTNGTDLFVVRGWREDLIGPLRYTLEPGRLVAEPLGIEIPEQEVRQQIDRALYPGVVSERKLVEFVAEFKRVVWELDPTRFEILYDLPSDPTLSIARLPRSAVDRLLVSARRIFGEADSIRIGKILNDGDDPDTLSVLVRQRVHIES